MRGEPGGRRRDGTGGEQQEVEMAEEWKESAPGREVEVEDEHKAREEAPLLAEEGSERMPRRKQQVTLPAWLGGHVSLATFTDVWAIVWSALFAALASTLTFWIPTLTLTEAQINVSSFLQNTAGSFVVAIVTTYQQDRFDILQTTVIYSSVKSGFLSVFTTFGNLIEDTERLFIHNYGLYSFLNLTVTLLAAFGAYQLGRLVSLRVKAGGQFSFALMRMESEDRRMNHELELQLEAADQLGRGREQRWVLDELLRTGAKRHETEKTPWPRPRHIFLLCSLLLVPLFNFALLRTVYGPTRHLPIYEYSISLFLCVSGAILGWHLGDKQLRRRDVMWGTFRVNMLSCILIGIVYNLLLFRNYFPHYNKGLFVIFMRRLITDFCGSISSFAGLVDETTCMWNSIVPRKIPVRNLYYNLLLCIAAFLCVVSIVRIMLTVVWSF